MDLLHERADGERGDDGEVDRGAAVVVEDLVFVVEGKEGAGEGEGDAGVAGEVEG